VYRWTDAQGNVFYGNQPPSDAQDVKLMFKETASAPGPGGRSGGRNRATPKRSSRTWKKRRREEEEARKNAESAKRSTPPSRDELIMTEKS
jgi:hypothetical protein